MPVTIAGGRISMDARGPDRWLVPAVTLAVFVNFLGSIALGPFLPAVSTDLGVGVALLGQIPALALLGAGFLGLVIGPLADRLGHRRALLLGLVAETVKSFATGLATGVSFLLAGAIVGTPGHASVLPVSQTLIGSRIADFHQRRLALSRLQTGQAAAGIVGIPLLTGVASLLAWRGAFIVLGLLTLVVVAVLARVLPIDSKRPVEASGRASLLAPYAPLLRDRPSMALVLAEWLGNAGPWMVLIYGGAFYVQSHGFSTQEVGWAYLGFGLGALIGQLLVGGRLGRRPATLVIVSRVATGCFIAISLLLALPALVTIVLMAAGFLANGSSNVGTVVLLSAVAPTERTTALAVNGSALSLSGAAGGALGGLLFAIGGYSALGAGALLLTLAAAVVLAVAPGRESPPTTPPTPVTA